MDDSIRNLFELREYELINYLGKGSFGQVYLVVDKITNEKKVIKQILISMNPKDMIDCLREIDLLKSLDENEYVIKYFDSFKEVCCMFLVLEYCNHGDLEELISSRKKSNTFFDEDLVMSLTKQILKAISFLHSKTIIHRDIKPANIFIKALQIKLGDLGLARNLDSITNSSTFCGTIVYMAPECINKENYNQKRDIWSFGCVLYELLTLERTFIGQNHLEIMNNILNKEIKLPQTTSKHEFYQILLDRSLCKRKENRANADELLDLIKVMNENNFASNQAYFSIKPFHPTIFKKAKTFECIQTLTEHDNAVTCFLLLKNGFIVSGSNNGTMKIWNSKTFEWIKTIKAHAITIMCLLLLENGNFVSGSDDQFIKIWNPNTFECIKELEGGTRRGNPSICKLEFIGGRKIELIEERKQEFIGGRAWIMCLISLRDNNFASGSYDGLIKIWDSITFDCLRILNEHSNPVLSMILLDNGNFISSSNNEIKLWNSQTFECIKTCKDSHCVNRFLILKDDNFVSGSQDGTISIWDSIEFKCIKIVKEHKDVINSLILLENGNFASGSHDKTIKIWNCKNLECIRTLEGHSDWVYGLLLLENGNIVSGSYDNTIKIWDT